MLTYTFSKTEGISLYQQLYQHIKGDILAGRLAAGEKLPSKRMLADHLEISVITVKNAYEQLLAEGYIRSVEKVGYFDESFTYILDFDMWVRLACSGDVYIIHQQLNSFRIRNDSNTGNLIGENRDVYVDEHKRLVEKHASNGVIKLSKFDIGFSVWFRKVRNVLIGIYLKLFSK